MIGMWSGIWSGMIMPDDVQDESRCADEQGYVFLLLFAPVMLRRMNTT
jgi:hypothetical protein